MAQWNKNEQSYRSQDTTLFEAVVISDQFGNPINSLSTATSNVYLASGLLSGYSHINKFGYRDSVSTTFETIWDGINPYSFITTPGTASITSTDGGDIGNPVELQGLDADYNLVYETVNVGSTGTQVFSRVFRAAAEHSNVGDISVTIDSAERAKILTGAGQTLMAVYTVPAGKTAFLLKFQGSIDKSNGDCKFRIMARPFGNGFKVKGQFGTAAGSSITYDYPIPLKFEEKTDIAIHASAGSTLGAGAVFDLVLVDNA